MLLIRTPILHLLLSLCVFKAAVGYRLPVQVGQRAQADNVVSVLPKLHSQSVLSPVQPYSDAVPITSRYASWFQTVSIGVGTPPQEFRALLDIAWEDLLVPAKECSDDSAGFCDSAWNRYDRSRSSTSVPLNESVEHRYWAMIFNGRQTQDTVSFAGLEVKNQTFSNVYDVRPEGFIAISDWDSVLGLDRPRVGSPDNELQRPSVWQNILDRGLIDQKLFGLKLARDEETEGELLIGERDSSYEDELIELPLSDLPDDLEQYSNDWHVAVHSLSFGDDIERDLQGFHAFFDTSAFIQLPGDVVEEILEVIGPEGGFQWLDCERRDSLPSWTFTLGPQKTAFTISPWDYIIEVKGPEGETKCWVPITDAASSKTIVLGSGFLRAFYSVFDVDSPSVSLARLHSNSSQRRQSTA